MFSEHSFVASRAPLRGEDADAGRHRECRGEHEIPLHSVVGQFEIGPEREAPAV